MLALFHNGASVLLKKTAGAEIAAAQIQALFRLSHKDRDEEWKRPMAFGTELLIAPRYRLLAIRDVPVKLTRKEFDLLYYFARHPGMVLTYEQMYQHVWGEELIERDIHTVQTHIWTLQRK